MSMYLAFIAFSPPFANAFFVPASEHVGRAITTNNEKLLAMHHLSGGRRKQEHRILARGGHQSSPASNSHPLTSSTTAQSSHSSSDTPTSNSPATSNTPLISRALQRFIQLLFKGMTLPFPMLREIGKVDGEESTAMLGFSLRECILAIFAYLCLGTLGYSLLVEKWSCIDSLYFSVVTFTSTGYGDLCPDSLAAKMFTCFFGLSGLAFLGAALSTIGSSLLGKEKEFIKAAETASRNQIRNIFEGMPTVVKNLRLNGDNKADSVNATTFTTNTDDDILKQHGITPVGWRATVQKAVVKLIPSLTFLWLGGMIMARIEGWKWTDSIYYSIITGSTIGFGDFCPKTRMGRAYGIFFIPCAVAAAGDVLGNVGSSLVERRQAKVFKELMNRELTMDNLLSMDEDENGKVSREEYVRFMLTEMGLVEPEEFDELYGQFQRLDADGSGYLDKADLHLMANHRSKKQSGVEMS